MMAIDLRLFPGLLDARHGRGLRGEPADPVPAAGSVSRGVARLELLRRHLLHVHRRRLGVPAVGEKPVARAPGRPPRAGHSVQRLLSGASQDPGLRGAVSGDRQERRGLAGRGQSAAARFREGSPPAWRSCITDVGLERIRSKVVRHWRGGRVACYYGCQLVRPYAEADRPHDPTRMDELLQAVGVPTVDYSLKTKCCGGSLTGTIHEVGVRLNYILLKEAARKGAEAIVTICPLCQYNLDAYQAEIRKQDRRIAGHAGLLLHPDSGLGFGRRCPLAGVGPRHFGAQIDRRVVPQALRGGGELCLRRTAPSASASMSATAAPTSPPWWM